MPRTKYEWRRLDRYIQTLRRRRARRFGDKTQLDEEIATLLEVQKQTKAAGK